LNIINVVKRDLNTSLSFLSLFDSFLDSGFSCFLLLGYTLDDTTIGLQASGTGGIEELLGQLKDDEVQYALLRLPEEKDGLLCNKDIFIAWSGPTYSKIKAAKKATYMGEIEAVLAPNHAQLTASGRIHFNEQTIRALSSASSGSHHIE